MNDHMKNLTDFISEKFPMAFRATHPRNITPPPGYANPKHYSTSMVANMMVVHDPAMRQLPHLTAYMTALQLVANKVPTYFVAYEFCHAVANTDLPLDFKFAEIKWPLDAQLFVLPDQFVYQYFGCYAPYLAVCRCPKGLYPDILKLPPLDLALCDFENQVDKFSVDYPVYHLKGTPTDYNGNYPLNMGIEVFKTADWVDSTIFEQEYHGVPYGLRDQELTPDQEKVFVDKALMFAMKLMLAVSCRPSAVEHGHCTRPAKFKKGVQIYKDMWSPNIIGRTYRIPRQKAAAETGVLRAKPRFTFRRGHYAWVAKRFKDVEFVSVEAMPHKADGTIDFDVAGEELSNKFRAVHERQWLEGILFGDDAAPESH